MTIKEMFNTARLEAEANVRKNEIDTIVYMSGSKNKKTKFEKLLKEYKDQSNLDFELGVIAESIHDFEMQAANILERSIENFSIY